MLSHTGGDDSVVKAMLVSTKGDESLDAEATPGRINFLMENRHGTPFEHNYFTFFVAAPIFVFREFHRHRIGFSYNEMSGRYSKLPAEFYVPGRERPLIQKGKPGRYIFVPEDDDELFMATIEDLCKSYEFSYRTYERIMARGHAKEIARACLPVGIYSQMYVTCNARSLMSFLSLRTKADSYWTPYGQNEVGADLFEPNPGGSKFPSYPQHEIELVARRMETEFARVMPLTFESFCNNGRVSP